LSIKWRVSWSLRGCSDIGWSWEFWVCMTVSYSYISIIFVQIHQNFALMIITFLHRYSSRKVASKKVADNISSQFNVPVEVSYKLTLIKFFVAYNPTYCFLSS
jgi:hypothetical protein